jgi:hypothetical protein
MDATVAATWKPKLEGHHTEYTGILSALYVENSTLELIQRNILN